MNRRQRRRLAWLKTGATLAPPSFLAGAYLLGATLPPVHAVRVELAVSSSAEQVWAVLADLDAMPSWRRDLVSLQRLPAGRGIVRWREVSAGGSERALERLEGTTARIVIRTTDGQQARRWVYQIFPAAGGSRLAVTAERTIGNPLERAAVRAFGSAHRELEQLARDLGARLAGRRQLIADVGGR